MQQKYSDHNTDLQAENDDLRDQLALNNSNLQADRAQYASEFQSKCEEWNQIVDDMGKFTVEGARQID